MEETRGLGIDLVPQWTHKSDKIESAIQERDLFNFFLETQTLPNLLSFKNGQFKVMWERADTTGSHAGKAEYMLQPPQSNQNVVWIYYREHAHNTPRHGGVQCVGDLSFPFQEVMWLITFRRKCSQWFVGTGVSQVGRMLLNYSFTTINWTVVQICLNGPWRDN